MNNKLSKIAYAVVCMLMLLIVGCTGMEGEWAYKDKVTIACVNFNPVVGNKT